MQRDCRQHRLSRRGSFRRVLAFHRKAKLAQRRHGNGGGLLDVIHRDSAVSVLIPTPRHTAVINFGRLVEFLPALLQLLPQSVLRFRQDGIGFLAPLSI